MKFYETETGIETSEGLVGTKVCFTKRDKAYTEVMKFINKKTSPDNWLKIRKVLDQYEKVYGHIDEIPRANVLRRMKTSLEKVI